MKRFAVVVFVLSVIGAGMVYGEGGTPPQAQAPTVAKAEAPAQPRVTRTYRSYSVAPSARTGVRHSQHASHATWRHADSKAGGQFHSGR